VITHIRKKLTFCARSRHGFRGSDWEFCFISCPFIFNASSLIFSVDSTAFSFLFSFYLYVCILLFHLSIWFSPWVCFVSSSVSHVVITDCPSPVNYYIHIYIHTYIHINYYIIIITI